jgi:hypothetical protein
MAGSGSILYVRCVGRNVSKGNHGNGGGDKYWSKPPSPHSQSLRCLPGRNSVNSADGGSTYLRNDGITTQRAVMDSDDTLTLKRSVATSARIQSMVVQTQQNLFAKVFYKD